MKSIRNQSMLFAVMGVAMTAGILLVAWPATAQDGPASQEGKFIPTELEGEAKEGEEEVIGSSILTKKKELEGKIYEAQMRLRDVKMKKRESIESLGNRLRNLNTLPGPILMVLIAIMLGIYRSTKKRHYISHASDA